MRKIYNIITISLLSVLLLACEQNIEWNGTPLNGLLPDLAFTLENMEGQTVSEQDYSGKISLLFFGYTYCPDVCPTTLSRAAAALRQLTPEQRQQIQVLFISVDPARDTPEQLKAYTSAFGPEFIGFSGDENTLKALVKRYRVTYGYGDKDDSGNYEVSHSSAIFAFNRQNQASLLITDGTAPDAIAQDLKQLLKL